MSASSVFRFLMVEDSAQGVVANEIHVSIETNRGTIELSLKGDDLARRWTVERGAPVRVTWE